MRLQEYVVLGAKFHPCSGGHLLYPTNLRHFSYLQEKIAAMRDPQSWAMRAAGCDLIVPGAVLYFGIHSLDAISEGIVEKIKENPFRRGWERLGLNCRSD